LGSGNDHHSVMVQDDSVDGGLAELHNQVNPDEPVMVIDLDRGS